jgi:hypothetical protein
MDGAKMDRARIDAELAKLISESGRLVSEAAKLRVETAKLNAETSKLNAGTAKGYCERYWLPAVYIAGLFAAALTVAKLFPH